MGAYAVVEQQIAKAPDSQLDEWELRCMVQEEARAMERDFSEFFRGAWHVLEGSRKLKWNWHLTVMCDFLQAFAYRQFHNGIINIPPRFTKSLTVSVAYPIWVWIQPPEYDEGNLKNPTVGPQHQFLCLSNDDDLVMRDAAKARDLILSEWFIARWGHRVMLGSQQEKGYYTTSKSGHRTSRSLGAKLTGKGGDTILMDDPHDAERALSDLQRLTDINNYKGKVVTRLNDQEQGGKLLIMQRLHHGDMVESVVKMDGLYHPDKNPYGWVKLCLPMEYELDEPRKPPVNPAGAYGFVDPRETPQELLDPNRTTPRAVQVMKDNLGTFRASGQLQQRPTPIEGGILKKKWWRKWPTNKPFPRVNFVIQTYDTAFTEKHEKEAAQGNPSYSARLTLGVFHDETEGRDAIILLEAWRDFVSYPVLRREFKSAAKTYDPDMIIIEKKASGTSLIQDARASGIGVHAYEPEGDKIARAYAIQNTLESGFVYYPDRIWAEEVVDDTSMFPNGVSSDWTDCLTQALIRMRRLFKIEHKQDLEDDYEKQDRRKSAYG